MRKLTWLGLLAAATLQVGCQQATKVQGAAGGLDKAAAPLMLQSPPPAEAIAEAAPAPPPAPVQPALAAAWQAPALASRLLIYHAEVRLKTEAMPRAAARLDSLVRRSGGYLSAATETRADDEWRQASTIRVPLARFQALLSGLSGLGTIEEKKMSTDDVTAEHADVAARLQAKRAVEHQYTALLGRARTIKEILEVQAKLAETREDIEATESRLKTLNDEVSYSTITLTLYQLLPQAVPDAPVVSLGSRLVEAVYTGWSLLVSLLLGAITIWPLLLLSAVGSGLWLRYRARRRPTAPVAS